MEARPTTGKEAGVRIRRIASSLGWLAALILAAGAGWKTH
jgi:hypothetical protein